MPADESDDLGVLRREELDGAAPESLEPLAQGDQPLGPPEQGIGIGLLRFDIERFVMILGVDIDRQDQSLRIGFAIAGIAVGAPLHGRAHAVAVAEKDVVAHADLVAVIEDRRAGQ